MGWTAEKFIASGFFHYLTNCGMRFCLLVACTARIVSHWQKQPRSLDWEHPSEQPHKKYYLPMRDLNFEQLIKDRTLFCDFLILDRMLWNHRLCWSSFIFMLNRICNETEMKRLFRGLVHGGLFQFCCIKRIRNNAWSLTARLYKQPADCLSPANLRETVQDLYIFTKILENIRNVWDSYRALSSCFFSFISIVRWICETKKK